MSFVEAVRSVYRNYANFSGRATRSEFWWFWLFYVIVAVAAYVAMSQGGILATIGLLALVIFSIGSIIPSLAVAVRRLHDTGRSGWWLLINFIPFGGLVLLIFYLLPSTPGPNAFGNPPMSAMA
jgi:uncharacterized membrane protein YhaH (DUF805 family)